jgi:aminopeptidase
MVWSTPWARPLLEQVMEQLGRRGAYPLLRLTFSGGLVYHRAWLRHAPLEVISEPASVDGHALQQCDAVLAIAAPENTRDGADIGAERTSAVERAYRNATSRLRENEVPWLMCWYPTPALAQDAGMTLPAFEDFLYGACLIDWGAEHERISRYAKLFDEAEQVRIVGERTDLRLSVAGRRTDVDAGFGNMPGGEFFVCPVETSAEGTIAFTEFPAVRGGRELRGVRLRFSKGRVVDASAETEEDFLLDALDSDEGARRIGELGIGCNPGIDRYLGNV